MNSYKLVSASVIYMNICNIRIHTIYEFMQKKITHPFFSEQVGLCTKFGLDIYEFNYNINSYKLVSDMNSFKI
jgi:hypothetical protein